MNRHYLSFVIFTFVVFLSCLSLSAQTSRKDIKNDNLAFRKALNAEFRDSTESPLTTEDRMSFKQLDFFPVKTKFRVKAVLLRTPDTAPFEMPRSKGNTGTYRKYGEATFFLSGKKITVSVYQYMKLINNPKYAQDLFLPFGDLTNAVTTYGAGRFIDLKIPQGDTLIIDFNKAYNPLCAYNSKYSCPIPPKENQIPLKITAGVKKFGAHH